jgi:hypothetical protein
MQDPNQTQNQTTAIHAVSASQPQQVGRPVEPPTVFVNKEHEPIIPASTEFTPPPEPRVEIAASVPAEVMITQELKNTIEKSPDAKEPKIEKEARLAGLTLAKESTPVITSPTGIIRLPMTYVQALQKKNNSPFWDSIHWFAALIMYQWSKYEPDVVKEAKIK